jgi:hypothetical protein
MFRLFSIPMKAKRFLYLALICVVGCAPTTLTDSGGVGLIPAKNVDPSQWQVAFEREGDIWIANGDGSNERLLIKNGSAPEWSPDGEQIAFVRAGSVLTADANGKSVKLLHRAAEDIDTGNDDVSISWNPQTTEIVYSQQVGDGTGIFYVRDGDKSKAISDLQPGTSATAYRFSSNSNPEWSPTGTYMAFARNGDVWLCKRTFEEQTDNWDTGFVWDADRLAATARYDAAVYRASREIVGAYWLSWSGDERSLAYGVRRMGGSGTNEIHVLRLEAAEDSMIGKSVVKDELIDDGLYPAFCPDGQTLSYAKQSEGDHGWHVVIRQPSGKTQAIIKDAWQPAWRPRSL